MQRVNKQKQKIKIFKFFNKVGNLLFFKRHSNLFFVLLDSDLRHVFTFTSGNCKLGRTKKQKIAPLNMLSIVPNIKKLCDKHGVKHLNIRINKRPSFYFFNLIKLLKMYNLTIQKYSFILKIPHSIVRGRKARRI